jgi:hypothetical protein
MPKFEKYFGPVRIEMLWENLQPSWKKWKNSKIANLENFDFDLKE